MFQSCSEPHYVFPESFHLEAFRSARQGQPVFIHLGDPGCYVLAAECDRSPVFGFEYVSAVIHIADDIIPDLAPVLSDVDLAPDESHFRISGCYQCKKYGNLPQCAVSALKNRIYITLYGSDQHQDEDNGSREESEIEEVFD